MAQELDPLSLIQVTLFTISRLYLNIHTQLLYLQSYKERMLCVFYFYMFCLHNDELSHVSQMDDGRAQQPTTFGGFLVIKISHRTVFFKHKSLFLILKLHTFKFTTINRNFFPSLSIKSFASKK